MNNLDPQILSQLPVVGLFMIFLWHWNNKQMAYMLKRDEDAKVALLAIAEGMRLLSKRVHELGLGFVALAAKGSCPDKVANIVLDEMQKENEDERVKERRKN